MNKNSKIINSKNSKIIYNLNNDLTYIAIAECMSKKLCYLTSSIITIISEKRKPKFINIPNSLKYLHASGFTSKSNLKGKMLLPFKLKNMLIGNMQSSDIYIFKLQFNKRFHEKINSFIRWNSVMPKYFCD